MKQSTKIAVLIAALCCFMGLALITISLYMIEFDFTKLSTQTYVEREYTLTDPFSAIKIDAVTSDVRFLPSENDNCRVICTEQEKMTHRITVEDNTLTIRTDDQRSWYDHLGIHIGQSSVVTIYLPQLQYDQLKVRTDTGDLQIPADFSFTSTQIHTYTGDIKWSASGDSVVIDTDTGNITLEGGQIQYLQIETQTGNIRIGRTAFAIEADLNTDTGDVHMDEVTTHALLIVTHTGDISLENTVADGLLAIKTNTGDIEFNRFDAATLAIETITGDVTGTLLSPKMFLTHTNTGDVSVPQSYQGGICEITTDTGDIELSFA